LKIPLLWISLNRHSNQNVKEDFANFASALEIDNLNIMYQNGNLCYRHIDEPMDKYKT